jgi:hypothetical protein
MPADVPLEESLKQVIHEIDRRLRAEASPEEAAKLLMATYVLTGLRVRREVFASLFQGVGMIQESSAYDYFLDEGQIKHASKLILRLGSMRFGAPDDATRQALASIKDLDRLDRLYVRLAEDKLAVSSWQDLLETP